MNYKEIKAKAFIDELTKVANIPAIASNLGKMGVEAATEAAKTNPSLIKKLLQGVGNTITETGSHLLDFAKHPISVGSKNFKEMFFGGLKPGASTLEKIFFNPVTQGYFMGYLPLRTAYDIATSDSKHKGEQWGQWAGSQAGMLAVPMTANLVPAIAANVAMTAIGRKAGELLDTAKSTGPVRYAAPRTEDKINDQLAQAQIPVY